MGWDWRKALQLATPSAATVAAPGAVSAGKAMSGRKRHRKAECEHAFGQHRLAHDGSWECQVGRQPHTKCWRTGNTNARSAEAGAKWPAAASAPSATAERWCTWNRPRCRCAFCEGQGQMPPRSNLTCWVCKGKGLVPVTPPVQTCPDCQGRGKRPCESLYCPRCRGVGVVTWSDGL